MPVSTEIIPPETRPAVRQVHDIWPGPVLRWTFRLLTILAASISAYLAWVVLSAGKDMLGCGGRIFFDCDHVLFSRWSKWLEIPVSLPALGIYLSLFFLSFFINPRTRHRTRRRCRRVMVVLIAMAATAAVWFLGLLYFVLGQMCLYCLIVHGCGLMLALLVYTTMPLRRTKMTREEYLGAVRASMGIARGGPRRTDLGLMTIFGLLTCTGIGVASMGLLVAGQLIFPSKQYHTEEFQPIEEPEEDPVEPIKRHRVIEKTPSNPPQPPKPVTLPTIRPPARSTTGSTHQPTFEKPISSTGVDPTSDSESELLSILGGRLKIDTRAHPILGDPEAPFVVVKLFDYTCKHCRHLHKNLEDARRRYGKQFAVLLVPVPMSTRCNNAINYTHRDHQNACRFASIALAVWKAAPEQFEAFHHELMELEETPEYSEMLARATKIVDPDTLEEGRYSQAVKDEIEFSVRLYRKCEGGGIPQLVLGNFKITLMSTTSDELYQIIEKHMDIRPISP